ncbi:MAG: YraN family protein [Phycisphaerales bacterium]
MHAPFRRRLSAIRHLRHLLGHLRVEGLWCAFAFAWKILRGRLRARDAGERCAERYLRAMGHRIVARNWRGGRDPRDEADLIAATADGREVVVVEVKRASGPWCALGRVDRRKRAVLWRIAGELSTPASLPAAGNAAVRRALERADHIRVDLISVRGEGRSCTVEESVVGVFERRVQHGAARSADQHAARQPLAGAHGLRPP